MSLRGVDGESLPLRVVGGSDGGVVCRAGGVADDAADFRHGLKAYDALYGEVGLVGELAGEVVGAELHSGDEGVLDEVLGPLLEDWVMGGEEGGVGGEFVVGECHEDHVAGFFDGHVFVVAFDVAGGVGEVRAQVVHAVVVGVEVGFLVDVERFHYEAAWRAC